MKVTRYNYAAQFPDGIDKVVSNFHQMLLQGSYVLSREVAQFESAFANYHGMRFAKGVNTGTDAIMVLLTALGLPPDSQVITQANTFNATVTGILMAGARPVLVDAQEDSFLIDVGQVDSAITASSKVLMPVHLFGKPTPMAGLLELAKTKNLLLVEDAAQAHGARLGGKTVGSFGVAACFSFHPSKNLAAAGDGGAIITNQESLAQSIEEVRSLGQRGQNNHVLAGCNSKLDAIQAMVLSAKLSHLDGWNAGRRTVAAAYRERLAGLPLRFQAESAEEEHVYHLFQIRTQHRDSLLKHLVAAGVDAVVRYPQPIHLQPAFADFGWRAGQFPVAEALAKELLCLPIRPDLTIDEIDYICDCVRQFF